MNKEALIFCVQAAKKGDRQALEQLLLFAYGIVDYQCRKLLPTAQAQRIKSIFFETAIVRPGTTLSIILIRPESSCASLNSRYTLESRARIASRCGAQGSLAKQMW